MSRFNPLRNLATVAYPQQHWAESLLLHLFVIFIYLLRILIQLISINANLLIMWSSNPNKDDISLRKLQIWFEKCDTMKICPKSLALLELNRMMLQGQLYFDNLDLIFILTKITCCITQNTSLFYKLMA